MVGKTINITERQFQEQIRDLARVFGWKYYHTWQSIHSPAGFPDLVMVRLSRLIVAELKGEKGKLSPEQEAWLEAFKATEKCEVYLWRPDDIDEIIKCLR